MFDSRCLKLAALAAVAGALAWGKAYTDVEYSQAGGQSLRMNAFVPDGAGPFPAAILVHGGAWVTGDKQLNMQPLFRPLEQARIAWFSIDYRLLRGDSLASLISPQSIASLQGAVDDVRNAVAYVKEHAAEYHVDPNRIALIGESAGAHLTLMASLLPADGAAVRASVAFYAPSDLVKLAETSNRIPDSVRRAVKGSPLEAMLMAGLAALSPRNFVHKGEPPALLIHGTRDSLVPFEQSVDLCDSMREAGASCDLETVDGGGHGMRWWQQGSYQQSLMAWLAKALQ